MCSIFQVSQCIRFNLQCSEIFHNCLRLPAYPFACGERSGYLGFCSHDGAVLVDCSRKLSQGTHRTSSGVWDPLGSWLLIHRQETPLAGSARSPALGRGGDPGPFGFWGKCSTQGAFRRRHRGSWARARVKGWRRKEPRGGETQASGGGAWDLYGGSNVSQEHGHMKPMG